MSSVITKADLARVEAGLMALAQQQRERPGSSIAGLIPLLFSFKQKPLEISHRYFLHEPVFKLHGRPLKTTIKASRQVGKSLSLGVDAIFLSSMIPGFKSMAAFPLQSQANWFSSEYLKPLIQDSPLIAERVLRGSDAVGQRAFDGRGAIYMRYIGNGADRARGSAIDLVGADECLWSETRLDSPVGSVKITDVTPGDVLYAFNPNTGILGTCQAKRLVYKGIRPVWRISLADGSSLTCTDNERLWTPAGWAYASDVCRAAQFRAIDPAAAAVGAGLDAGGHVYQRKQLPGTGSGGNTLATAADQVACGPGNQAGGLRAPQSGYSGELRSDRARDSRESRVRLSSGALGHGQLSGARLLGTPVLPVVRIRWKARQDRHQRMAGSPRLGGGRVLADGRRLERSGHCDVPHPGVHPVRSGVVGELVDVSGYRRFRVERTSGEHGGIVLGCSAVPRLHQGVGRPGASMGAARTSVQAGGCPDCTLPVLDLRYDRAGQGPTVRLRVPDVRPDLSTGGPPDGSAAALPDQPGREGAGQHNGGRAARLVYPKPGAGQQNPRGGPRSPLGYKASHAEGSEDQCIAPGEAHSRTEGLLGSQDGKIEVYTRGLRGLHGGEECLTACEVVSCEYQGEEPVYDVETDGHHTLFAEGFAVHNCQDLDVDALSVVENNMSASPYKLMRWSGTPKTTDNLLEQSWLDSSRAIWVIPCRSCGHFNDASPDHELMKMLGDETLVCAKCGVRVDSSLGWYRHQRPDRLNSHSGYEMPGPCFPHNYLDPVAWFKIKEAQRTKPLYLFTNEYLGGSFDGGSKLITPEEVKQAATVPWCEPRDFVPTPYVAQHIGVDWGGKGKQTAQSKEEFISNTAVALAALRPDGRVEIPWLYAMPYTASYEEEARITCQAAQLSGAEYIAHDAGGGGDLRQSILENAGWPLGQIAPFTYGNMSASKPIVFFIPPERAGVRVSYTVDKARSLGLLIHLIKTGWVLLPEWARAGQFLEDFQSIFEETRDTPSGAPKRYISRISGRHDDVVHAINFAVMSLYHSSGMWPDVAKSFRAQGIGADEPENQ